MSEYKSNKVQKLTIIVPVHNEQDCIENLCAEVDKTLAGIGFESYDYMFVDDGSTDDSLEILKRLAQNNNKIKYVSFSRNFEKEAAIYAGIEQSVENGSSHYVLMDADLQDPPSLIPEMIKLIDEVENCNCVCACRKTRDGEPVIRSAFSRLFYKIINKVSSIELKNGARDFKLMSKKYCESILKCGEYNRFFKGISSWVGFKVEWLEYDNIERTGGNSSWSFFSLFKYSMEALIAYTTWPLNVISVLGAILSLISFVALIVIFVRALMFGDPVAGWPSLTCILLLIGSLILMALGILGLYFEKMYLEVKKRPLYIIDQQND